MFLFLFLFLVDFIFQSHFRFTAKLNEMFRYFSYNPCYCTLIASFLIYILITVVYLLRIPLHYIDIHYIHTYTILLHCYHLKLASNSILKKQRSWPSSTVTSCQIEGGKVEAVTDFVFLGPKSLRTVTEAMKLKKKKMPAPLKESYDKPWQHIQRHRYRFADKVSYSHAMVFFQ